METWTLSLLVLVGIVAAWVGWVAKGATQRKPNLGFHEFEAFASRLGGVTPADARSAVVVTTLLGGRTTVTADANRLALEAQAEREAQEDAAAEARRQADEAAAEARRWADRRETVDGLAAVFSQATQA